MDAGPAPMMAGASVATKEIREAVGEALRSEFSQLQQNLIQAVRSELEKPNLCRQRSQDSSGVGTPSFKGTIARKAERMRGFLPLKTYKVKQYQQWLKEGEQDDNLDVDVDIDSMPSMTMDREEEPSVFLDKDRKPPRPDAAKVHCIDHDDYLPNASMPVHPLAPETAEEDTAADEADSPELRTSPSRPLERGSTTSSAERAMGLGPRAKTVNFTDNKTPYQERAVKLVRSIYFEGVVMAMIILSAIHIGWQTDHMARHVLAEQPTFFRVLDLLFMTFFELELILRLFAFRSAFFYMWGWGWNILDFFLVVLQAIEETANWLANDDNVEKVFSTSIILKILRILRFVRVVRVLHVMRFADELRLLVSCIAHSAKAFCWSTALLLLILYVMAVNLVALTLSERLDQHFADQDEAKEAIRKLSHWYGSVPRAVLSLFQGLTGGLDWNELVEPFSNLNADWIGVVFFFYMAFVILAVMNVVTATFVEQAIERAAKVKEVQKVSHASRLFKSIDTDHSGVISYDEIASHLETRAVKEFFKSIDVDVTEAQWLFDLLDHDNSGRLEFGEFLTGCLRLQGPAKSIDLVLVMRELKDALRR